MQIIFRFKQRIFVAIILTFISCQTNYGQSNQLPSFLTDSLEAYILKGMKDWQIPGLAVAVVKDNQTILTKGYGVTSLENPQAVDENTLFIIGSNTKAFTATILALLEAEGKMTLDDRVKKWLPEFDLKNKLAANEITISDLLSHRIGFETFQGDFTYWASDLTRDEVVQKMGLIDAPYSIRSRWGYCNAAYVAAGQIIPKVIGLEWENALDSMILKPVGMNRTLPLSGDYDKAENKAMPYTLIKNKLTSIPIANTYNLAPAGDMSSSVKDMSRWLHLQLNNGVLDGKQVLSKQAILTTRTPASIIGVDNRFDKNSRFKLYGLGWNIRDINNYLEYSHTGGVDGFLSMVMFIPEINLGIVVLSNTDKNFFYQNVVYQIRDAFLGLPYRNHSDWYIKRFNSDAEKQQHRLDSLEQIIKTHQPTPQPLDSYVGTYENEVYGTIEIKSAGKDLVIYFSRHPGLTGRMSHVGANRFLCTYSNPTMGIEEIPFHTKEGDIIGFTLRVSDFIEHTTYEFYKVR